MPRNKLRRQAARSKGGDGGDLYAPVVPAFSPSDLTNLVLWWKADALSLADGDPVASWTDSSGGGITLTAAGVARPTYKTNIVNSNPVVRFDGTNNVMTKAASGLTVTDDYTQFIVMKPTGASASYIFDPKDNASQAIIYAFEANMVEALASPRVNIGTYDGTNFAVYEVIDDNANRIGLKNGTQTESVAAGAGSDVSTGTVTLGDQVGGGAAKFAGDIAEVIWYSDGKSAGNRSSVRSYLGTKYNITVV